MFFSVPEVTVRLEDIFKIVPNGEETVITVSFARGEGTIVEYKTAMPYNEVVAKLYNTIKLWTNLEER